MVPDRDLDDVLFVVSHMVVEVDDSSVGRVLKFNGTTEWALDIVESGAALWLPREDELRGDAAVASFVGIGSATPGRAT